MQDNDRITNELIGLIYETAKEPNVWPVLLGGLSSIVNEQDQLFNSNEEAYQADNVYHLAVGNGVILSNPSKSNNQILQDKFAQELVPHFQRALEINKQLSEVMTERNSAASVLERLPLGVIIVKPNGAITSMNNQARHIISSAQGLNIKNDIICTDSSIETKSLHSAIKLISDRKHNQPKSHTFTLQESNHHSHISILITPTNSETSISVNENLCSLLIATSETQQTISQEVLIDLYKLTPAEARITQLLVKGKTTEEITDELGISQHTIKTQLRSVFQKTDTHRQSELIGQLLTSPAVVLDQSTHNDNDNASNSKVSTLSFQHKLGTENNLLLKDGRNLCYEEYGDKSGKPILFCHSLIGSRLQGPPNTSQLSELGIRLIVPDRTGYGNSTHKPNRSILDWADDAKELIDHLELDKLYLAGYSAGGPHAAACAYRFPERCIRLGLISSMAPFESLKDLKGMKASIKMILALARHSPKLLLPLLRIMAKTIENDPTDYVRRVTADWSESDLLLIRNPNVMSELSECFIEAVKNGTDGVFNEQFLLAKQWNFVLDDIKSETIIWHGTADTIVPYPFAQSLSQINNNSFITYPDEGHLLVVEHWQEIFQNLVN